MRRVRRVRPRDTSQFEYRRRRRKLKLRHVCLSAATGPQFVDPWSALYRLAHAAASQSTLAIAASINGLHSPIELQLV